VENQSMEDFRVFPNPAGRYIYLRGIDGYDYLEVFDLSGRSIKSMSKLSRGMLEVSDMSPGVYVIRASGQGKSITCKFIKK